MSKQPSRATRFFAAQSLASDVRDTLAELKEELEEWLENMPENLQGGDKAEILQTAIDTLDELSDKCDDVANADVEFPTMMG